MEAVVGLLVMLLGVSHGVETYCDGRQNKTQCYGALGGTVVLRLMDNTSEIDQYKWTNNSATILHGGKKRKLSNLLESRSSFTPSDGTFRINSLSRTDGDEYTLETFDSNGQRSAHRTLQLIIEAAVSSVRLVPECLSNGGLRASCSSEGGDSPQYSWTLDGRPLTDAQLLSGNSESSEITVRQDVSGQLVCSVRNHVSNVSTEMTMRSVCVFLNCTLTNGTHISQWVLKDNDTVCIEPTTTPPIMTTEGKETEVSIKPSTNITSSNENSSNISQPWYISHLPVIAGVLSALVILLVIGVVIIYAHKKKQHSKPKDPTEDSNEQDLTYADVRIVKRPGRQVQQSAEAEVEYGQVKFTAARPRQTAEPARDDCTYAVVRHGR